MDRSLPSTLPSSTPISSHAPQATEASNPRPADGIPGSNPRRADTGSQAEPLTSRQAPRQNRWQSPRQNPRHNPTPAVRAPGRAPGRTPGRAPGRTPDEEAGSQAGLGLLLTRAGLASDRHFWKECPALLPCGQCGQVVEVATLNEHLLTECDRSQPFTYPPPLGTHADYTGCPLCGELQHPNPNPNPNPKP